MTKEVVSMKKVVIDPGCLSCGACEFNAPEVFTVTDIAHVKPGVDAAQYEEKVNKAIKNCPVQIIRWSHNDDEKR